MSFSACSAVLKRKNSLSYSIQSTILILVMTCYPITHSHTLQLISFFSDRPIFTFRCANSPLYENVSFVIRDNRHVMIDRLRPRLLPLGELHLKMGQELNDHDFDFICSQESGQDKRERRLQMLKSRPRWT